MFYLLFKYNNMKTFEQYITNIKNNSSMSRLTHTRINTDTSIYSNRHNDNQELKAYYRDWIQLNFINLEYNIINKHKLQPEIKSKEELHLLKLLQRYKYITNFSVTFKPDWRNKKLSKFKITESTKEKILSDWLNEDWNVTSIKNGGIITDISRVIRGKF